MVVLITIVGIIAEVRDDLVVGVVEGIVVLDVGLVSVVAEVVIGGVVVVVVLGCVVVLVVVAAVVVVVVVVVLVVEVDFGDVTYFRRIIFTISRSTI